MQTLADRIERGDLRRLHDENVAVQQLGDDSLLGLLAGLLAFGAWGVLA